MTNPLGADLVLLPRVDAPGAIELGEELLIAAELERLPAGIARRLDALRVAHQALREAFEGEGDGEGRRSELDIARDADDALDEAFAALHDFLHGWSRLAHEYAANASRAYAVIFPEGLQFTTLPYRQEWAEANARLARMKDEHIDEVIESLGGAPFLVVLRRAFEEYGRTLGMAGGQPPAERRSAREALSSFTSALREYALKVAAHADEEHGARLNEALLKPLARRRATVRSGRPPG